MSLHALEKRPWLVACISAAGTTLLVPSALALFAPSDLIDRAVQLGDLRLALALPALFTLTAAIVRLSLRSPKPEETSAAPVQAPAPRTYLR